MRIVSPCILAVDGSKKGRIASPQKMQINLNYTAYKTKMTDENMKVKALMINMDVNKFVCYFLEKTGYKTNEIDDQ